MKKIKGFFKDFRNFISRGNILDMAVGVIIGGAFSTIINALVNAILMPLITRAIPGGLDGFVTVLNPNEALATAETANKISYWGVEYNADVVNVMNWGALINAIINFLIIALILFIILRCVMNAKNKAERVAAIQNAFTKEERKDLRKNGKSRKEIRQLALDKLEAEKEAKAKAEAEAKANEVTELTLLKDIKVLLENQAKEKEGK